MTLQENAKVTGSHIFLVYVRYVATVPCKILSHISSNISILHMFISIKFTEASIYKTKKTPQKVIGTKLMFKMSTIHTNASTQRSTPLRNHCCGNGVVQQPPLPQQMFFELLHIMDPRTVGSLLKDTTDAVVQ